MNLIGVKKKLTPTIKNVKKLNKNVVDILTTLLNQITKFSSKITVLMSYRGPNLHDKV